MSEVSEDEDGDDDDVGEEEEEARRDGVEMEGWAGVWSKKRDHVRTSEEVPEGSEASDAVDELACDEQRCAVSDGCGEGNAAWIGVP